MGNPNSFDEAAARTEEMFAGSENVPGTEDVSAETQPSEVSQAEGASVQAEAQNETSARQGAQSDMSSGSEADGGVSLDSAVQTAEVAAQTAVEKDGQLREALAEIEALRKSNAELQGTVDELSKKNTDHILEEALTPPTLDINGLAFADEGAQRAAMAKYAEDLSAYNRQQIMREMSPALEYAKKGMREEETEEVVSALEQIPELSDIRTMRPTLDRIIAKNKWLDSDGMPLDEKYIAAYAMARGIDSINNPPSPPEPPKEPTPEELLAFYNGNPSFRELVEKQRLDTIKQSQQVPPFSASSGAVNAALDIKEKPQTLEEASRRTREMFGDM